MAKAVILFPFLLFPYLWRKKKERKNFLSPSTKKEWGRRRLCAALGFPPFSPKIEGGSLSLRGGGGENFLEKEIFSFPPFVFSQHWEKGKHCALRKAEEEGDWQSSDRLATPQPLLLSEEKRFHLQIDLLCTSCTSRGEIGDFFFSRKYPYLPNETICHGSFL